MRTTILASALMALIFVVTACNKAGSTPTATAKAFFDAAHAKDIQGIKNTLSKGMLDMIETNAKKRNKTLDEVLGEDPAAPLPDTFESKDENITGDTATLQIKLKSGKWDTAHFVKEDGQWKMAP